MKTGIIYSYRAVLPICLLLLLSAAGAVYSATPSDIERQLMCQCGCTMVLASCQCTKAEEMRAEIQTKLAAGVSPSKIIQDFVAMYGETVLAAPTKRGFNLTAWVIPFGALIAGLALLYLTVREFARRGRERSRELEAEYPAEDLEQFSEQIDEELKDYL